MLQDLFLWKLFKDCANKEKHLVFCYRKMKARKQDFLFQKFNSPAFLAPAFSSNASSSQAKQPPQPLFVTDPATTAIFLLVLCLYILFLPCSVNSFSHYKISMSRRQQICASSGNIAFHRDLKMRGRRRRRSSPPSPRFPLQAPMSTE